MQIDLTSEQKAALEKQHKTERDKRVADRIKAVLLTAEGWTQVHIAQALRIRPETVHNHLIDYIKEEKLKPTNGGSSPKLSESHTAELISHLETKTYLKVSEICAYVAQTYHISYSVEGMTKWLHSHGFSYKKPKGTPLKADPLKQEEFIAYYEKLMSEISDSEPVEFGDGVHPTMATKISYGWIKKGKKNDKLIATTASRTRLNLMGSLNLETMNLTIGQYKTINSDAMEYHFKALREKYPKAPKIHLILDRGPYNRSQKTQEAAKRYGIQIHYLPPYSPNLNPIERVWKVMNESIRNNRFFESADEFKKEVMDFFHQTWKDIALKMVDRINDNFQTIKQVSSS
jgi:transposase